MKLVLCIVLFVMCFALCAQDLNEVYGQVYVLREAGKYAEAAELLAEWLRNNEASYMPHYSAACHFALAGMTDEAFYHLEQTVALGWLDADMMEQDTDFADIHSDPRWEEILSTVAVACEEQLSALPVQHEKQGLVSLPPPCLDGDVSVEACMRSRRSVREYADESLTLDDISQVLWAAYGVTVPYDVPRLRGGLKTAPSAGATYPLEVYLAVWRVDGLDPGVYLYWPGEHALSPVRMGDFHEELGEACLEQPWTANAPASLVYGAVYSRTTDVYGPRGRERYVPMDLGHSAENVYLQVEAMGMGTVAVGAFDDTRLKLCVQMTQQEEPLYVMPLGKKSQ